MPLRPAPVTCSPLVTLRTHDIAERDGWIREAGLQSTIVGPQTGPWEMGRIPLPGCALVLSTEGADNIKQSHVDEDHCAFVFNLEGRGYVSGVEVPHDRFFLLGPGTGASSRVEAGGRWAALMIPMASLARYVDQREQALPAAARGGRTMYAPRRASLELMRQLLRTAYRALSDPTRLSTEAARVSFEEGLMGALLPALGEPVGPLRRSAEHARLFHRAQEHLRSYDHAVGIQELCAVLGVKTRILFYAFHEQTGMSPSRYMRLYRMNRVRRDLRFGDAASVTTAATRHGFFELGRFAAQYRAVFGETPVATLRTAAT